MIQIEPSQVAFYTIEVVGIALAVLDYTDQTKKLEKYIRWLLDSIAKWISARPIKEYIAEGFQTSLKYSAGIFAGGVLFLFFVYVLDGDVLFSAGGVFLLGWTIRSRLSRRFIFGCFVAVLWLIVLYPPNPDFTLALLSMAAMVLILTLYQIIGPVVLANIFILFYLSRIKF